MLAFSVRRCWIDWLFCMSMVVSLCGYSDSAWAQFGAQIFHPTPRSLRQSLTRAQRALAEQRYSDAVNDLQGILLGKLEGDDRPTDDSAQDFFMESNTGGGLTSVRAEVLRLIGNLPDAGREIYELQFGSEARALLNDAVADGDLAKLADVSRKYFHTAAGYEAALISGRWQLNQGQPLAAAMVLSRVVQSSKALKTLDPELSLLLAASWQCAGNQDKARDVLAELQRRMPAAAVQLEGERLPLFKSANSSIEVLKRVSGSSDWVSDERQRQWTMFRGNAARNGKGFGSGPLQNPRWRATIVGDFGDEQIVQSVLKRELDSNRVLIPSLQPLAVGDTVLMRTPDELVGIDFSSGKIVWVYPWTLEQDSSAALKNGAQAIANQQRELELSQRLWGDWAYGEISSDGRSVYMLDKMGVAMYQRGRQQIVGAGGFLRPNPNYPTFYNQLVSLDLTRQGALRWIVGDETGWDEPKLANTFFLGPPLPLRGRLYVLAETNGEIRLHALNSNTGTIEWSQQIAHVESRPILMDVNRRLAGSTPSYSDGVLLCPTSAGALVAIDLNTRSFLWAYTYSAGTSPERMSPDFQQNFQRSGPAGSRWLDATVTVSEGRVLLTPVDSNELHCIDLLTGKAAWPSRRREQNLVDALFVGCVHRGEAILVGKRSLVSIGLKDGRETWASPIELESQPAEHVSGRGFLADDYYYVPTTLARLLKIDLAKGQIVERIPTSGVLGNLVAYRDEIISLGTSHLSVHHQIEPLRSRVRQLLDERPNDPWALTRLGELHLHDGKPGLAFEALRKAHAEKPGDDTIGSLLVDSFLASLERDFRDTRQFVPQIEPLIGQADQRARFLRLFVAGAMSAGERNEAFRACLKLADLSFDPAWMGAESLEEIRPGWKIHRDTWIQSRISELLTSATSDERTTMEQLIDARLKTAMESLSPSLLRRFVAHFDGHASSKHARLGLADRLIRSEDWLEADLALVPLLFDPDTRIAAGATARHISLLAGAKQFEKAAVDCHRLLREWPDLECLPGSTGRQVVEAVAKDGPLAGLMQRSEEWPSGRVSVKDIGIESPSFTRQLPQITATVPVRDAAGGHNQHWIEFDTQQNHVSLRDRHGRNVFGFNIPDPSTSPQVHQPARTYGNLLIFMPRVQPLAINLFFADRGADDAIIWPRPQQDFSFSGMTTLSSQQATASTGNKLESLSDLAWALGGLGPITRHGVIWLHRSLQCTNTISGMPVWSRANVPTNAEIFGDDEFVILIDRVASDPLVQDNEVVVFRTADGSEVLRYRLPEHGSRWTAKGRNLLLWRDTSSGTELKLWNAVRNEPVWSETFPDGTKGTIVNGEEVGLCQKDGTVVIRSLSNSEGRLEAKVEPEAKLVGLYALACEDAYYLVVARPPASEIARPTIRGWPAISGSIYRLNRQSGALEWPCPATVDAAVLVPGQPATSPAIVLFGQTTSTQQQTGARTTSLSVLCIDKQTGRSVFSRRQIPPSSSSRSPVLAADLNKKSAQLTVGGQSFELTFTSEPRPPEPPVQDWSVANRDR